MPEQEIKMWLIALGEAQGGEWNYRRDEWVEEPES